MLGEPRSRFVQPLGESPPGGGDVQVGELVGEQPQMSVGLEPVRAVIEVQQRHVHDPSVNIDLQEKVKGYRASDADR